MNFISVTDANQYRYVFPNILSLDSFYRCFKYYIFSSCAHTCNLLEDTTKRLHLKNGEIVVQHIPSFFEHFKITPLAGNHEWISTTTLDRLVLPYTTHIKKAIYLDTDAFPVSESIFDLDLKVSEKGIGAIPNNAKIIDHIITFSEAEFLLPFVKNNFTTFNAGVLFLDFDLIRKNKLEEFVRELYEIGDNKIYINDEVILNLYDPKYKIYPLSYNVKPYEEHIFNDIDVVHFSGKEFKPWSDTNICKNSSVIPYYHLWKYYYTSLFS